MNFWKRSKNFENKWEKATQKEFKKEWVNITRKNLFKKP